jgi:WD40 repeat protein
VLTGSLPRWDARLAVMDTLGTVDAKFSMDGALIVSVQSRKLSKVRLWDGRTGSALSEFHLDNPDVTIESITFVPEGLACLPNSGIYNVSTGTLVHPFQVVVDGESKHVTVGALSTDGSRMITRDGPGEDTTWTLWDRSLGERLGEPVFNTDSSIEKVVFSHDGKVFVTASKKSLQLWETDGGRPIREFLKGRRCFPNTLALSPDGKRVVAQCWGEEQTLYLWKIVGDAVVEIPLTARNWKTDPLLATPPCMNWVVFAPDARYIAATYTGGKGPNRLIQLWDGTTGTPAPNQLFHSGLQYNIVELAFSPNSTRLLSCSGVNIRLWDVAGCFPPQQELVADDRRCAVAISLDGRWIASLGLTEEMTAAGWTLRSLNVWDATTRQLSWSTPLDKSGHRSDLYPFRYFAISPKGNLIAATRTESTIEVLSKTGVISTVSVGSKASTFVFSPDGKRIATGDNSGNVQLWETMTGIQLCQCKVEDHRRFPRIARLFFSSDGLRIISHQQFDTDHRVWDSTSG